MGYLEVKNKEVRKFKIEKNGDVITKYYWKKYFWIFGEWIPYHNLFGGNDAHAKTFIRKIDEFIDALENH